MSNPKKSKPHTVILGAGASRQAFLDGDANGRMVPLMTDLIKILELEKVFKEKNIEFKGKDFEKIQTTISVLDSKSEILEIIDKKVRAYFNNLSLPKQPTLYDHLLLSLRRKDFIATFNWDPFLYDAYFRNVDKFPLPRIIHLHENVLDWIKMKFSIKRINNKV